MEVFVAFDPGDADRAEEVTAALTRAGAGVDFTSWTTEEPGTYRDPNGSSPHLLDAAGGALVTDEGMIRRAVGVLALVTGRASDSPVLAAEVEVAHGRGTRVLGVRIEDGAEPPHNLSRRRVVSYEVDVVADEVRAWCEDERSRRSLPWHARLRRALIADRDARR